jgi:hypothetical protein
VKALPKASCGFARTHRIDADTEIIIADAGALKCFDTAARSCGSASILVNEMGADAGTTYVFEIEPGGATCHVIELSQDYSANFGGSTGQVNSVACSGISVTGRGVMLTCGGRDLQIPAVVSGELKAGA